MEFWIGHWTGTWGNLSAIPGVATGSIWTSGTSLYCDDGGHIRTQIGLHFHSQILTPPFPETTYTAKNSEGRLRGAEGPRGLKSQEN